jgi:hypothetical protein
VRYYRYRILLEDEPVGECFSASPDPRTAATEWLEKIPNLVSAGVRRVIRREPGLLIADPVAEASE